MEEKKGFLLRIDKFRTQELILIAITYICLVRCFIGYKTSNQTLSASASSTLLTYILFYIPILIVFPLCNRGTSLTISGICMVLFCAFRKTRAVDDWNYEVIFNSVSKSWSSIISRPEEKGFLLLNKIVSFFTSDYQTASVIILTISIILFLISIYVWANDVNSFFLVTHYYFFLLLRYTSAGLNRIQMATPFFLIMMYYLLEKKNSRRAFLLLILGTLFHISFLVNIVVFIPTLMNRTRQGKQNTGLVTSFVMGLSFVAIPVAISILLRFLPAIKYVGYDNSFSINISSFSIVLLILLAYFIVYSKCLIEDCENDNVKFFTLMSSLICGIYFQICFSSSALGRVSYYLFFSIPLLFGVIKRDVSLLYNRYISYFLFFLIAIVYFWFTQATDAYTQQIITDYANLLF